MLFRSDVNHATVWSLPGGMRKAGEPSLAAVARAVARAFLGPEADGPGSLNEADDSAVHAAASGQEAGPAAGITWADERSDTGSKHAAIAGFVACELTELCWAVTADARNTDNAWMETAVFHTHLADTQLSRLQAVTGSETSSMAWVRLGPDHKGAWTPGHVAFVAAVARKLGLD